MSVIRDAIIAIVEEGRDLTEVEATQVMHEIMGAAEAHADVPAGVEARAALPHED